MSDSSVTTVIFEGPDAVGKTTIMRDLIEYVEEKKSKHISVTTLKFPTEIPPKGCSSDWYMNDFEKAFDGLRVEIDEGLPDVKTIVFIDRSYLSTYAYQGGGHDILKRGLEIFDAIGAKESWIVYMESSPDVLVRKNLERRTGVIDNPDEMDTLSEELLYEKAATLLFEYRKALMNLLDSGDIQEEPFIFTGYKNFIKTFTKEGTVCRFYKRIERGSPKHDLNEANKLLKSELNHARQLSKRYEAKISNLIDLLEKRGSNE